MVVKTKNGTNTASHGRLIGVKNGSRERGKLLVAEENKKPRGWKLKKGDKNRPALRPH